MQCTTNADARRKTHSQSYRSAAPHFGGKRWSGNGWNGCDAVGIPAPACSDCVARRKDPPLRSNGPERKEVCPLPSGRRIAEASSGKNDHCMYFLQEGGRGDRVRQGQIPRSSACLASGLPQARSSSTSLRPFSAAHHGPASCAQKGLC